MIQYVEINIVVDDDGFHVDVIGVDDFDENDDAIVIVIIIIMLTAMMYI